MFRMLAITLLCSLKVSAAAFVYPSEWFQQSGKPKPGGTIRVSQWIDYKTFNPFTVAETDNLAEQMASGTGLFMTDPVTRKPIPLMAKKMPKVINNGKSFIVELRKGMRFSDGKLITADDFITTYNIHSDKEVGSPALRILFMGQDKVKARKIDTYTLQFDFPYPTALAYEKMSLAPWPKHVFGPVYKNKGAKGIVAMWNLGTPPKELVSPGAWVLKTFVPGQRALFQKNRYFGYWNKDSTGRSLPYASFLNRKILTTETGLINFLAGEQDFIAPNKGSDLIAIKKAIKEKGLKVNLIPNISAHNRVFFITFNWNKKDDPTREKLFRDPRFRRAMSHLTNRNAMIKLALDGMGTPAYTSASPTFKNYQFESTPKYKYDPKKALSLLSQLGFKNRGGRLLDQKGNPLEFNIATATNNTAYTKMTQIFADELKKYGISAKVQLMDMPSVFNLFDSEGENRNWDATMLSFSGFKPDFPFMGEKAICGAIDHVYNRMGEGKCLSEREKIVANLFKKGEQTLDKKAREKIGEQLLKADAEDQAIIYLASPNYHVAYNKRIGGWYKQEYMNSVFGPSPHGFITNYFQ